MQENSFNILLKQSTSGANTSGSTIPGLHGSKKPKTPPNLSDNSSDSDPEQRAAKLLGYDFKVFYKPGKENKVVDVLSRQKEWLVLAISFPIFPWLQLCDYYRTTTEGRALINRVTTNPTTLPGYQLSDGLRYFKDCLFTPPIESLRLALVQEFDSSTLGGHSGSNNASDKCFFFGHILNGKSSNTSKGVWYVNKPNTLVNNPMAFFKHF